MGSILDPSFFRIFPHRLKTFILDRLLHLASLELSQVAGACWVVEKSDFDGNLVVSLDLDLDFGLGLRVCQMSQKIKLNRKHGVEESLDKVVFQKSPLNVASIRQY